MLDGDGWWERCFFAQKVRQQCWAILLFLRPSCTFWIFAKFLDERKSAWPHQKHHSVFQAIYCCREKNAAIFVVTWAKMSSVRFAQRQVWRSLPVPSPQVNAIHCLQNYHEGNHQRNIALISSWTDTYCRRTVLGQELTDKKVQSKIWWRKMEMCLRVWG